MKKRRHVNIPEQTELLGRKVITKWNTPRVVEKGLYGSMNCITGELHLSEEINGHKVPVEEMEITYWHEMMHFILYKNNYEGKLAEAGIDLEKFVEDMAVAVHQVLSKAK